MRLWPLCLLDVVNWGSLFPTLRVIYGCNCRLRGMEEVAICSYVGLWHTYHSELIIVFMLISYMHIVLLFGEQECDSKLCELWNSDDHYDDVIMSAIASRITSPTTVYLIVYSCADQRKHQSSASLAFVRGIHRRPVNSPHKGPVTRKMVPFDDVIMTYLVEAEGRSYASTNKVIIIISSISIISIIIMCPFYYFVDRVLFHHFHHDNCDYYWNFYGHSFHFELHV